MRVFYLVFVGSALMLFIPSKNLKALGGGEYSTSRRVVHNLVLGVMAVVSGWYSAVQLTKDWARLKTRIKNRKGGRDKR